MRGNIKEGTLTAALPSCEETILTCAMFMFSMVPVASANTTSQSQNINGITHADKAKIEANEKIKNQFNSTIKELTPYVHRQENGVFELKAPKEVTDKIDPSVMNQIKSGMNMVNTYIESGKLCSKGLMVYDPTVTDYSIQGNLNYLSWTWWGFMIYLDNTSTQQVLALIAIGAGTATIAAAIAGMVPGGQFISGCLWAVDGLMGIGYGVIAYYAAPGQGIIIFGWTYSYPYSVWLGSQ